MNKFKVGDKVKVVKVVCGATCAHIGDVGIVKKVINNNTIKNAVEFERRRNVYHSCSGSCKEYYGYWCADEMLELVEESKMKPIVIYRNGNEVVAIDKNTGQKATAKCCPEDEFDFRTGAKIAFDRLINTEEKPKKLHLVSEAGADYGVVGTQTKIVDIFNRPLCVGDVVVKFDEKGKSYGESFICEKDGIFAVMGIFMSCKPDGTLDKWRVCKTKDHKQIVAGDRVLSLRVVEK